MAEENKTVLLAKAILEAPGQALSDDQLTQEAKKRFNAVPSQSTIGAARMVAATVADPDGSDNLVTKTYKWLAEHYDEEKFADMSAEQLRTIVAKSVGGTVSPTSMDRAMSAYRIGKAANRLPKASTAANGVNHAADGNGEAPKKKRRRKGVAASVSPAPAARKRGRPAKIKDEPLIHAPAAVDKVMPVTSSIMDAVRAARKLVELTGSKEAAAELIREVGK